MGADTLEDVRVAHPTVDTTAGIGCQVPLTVAVDVHIGRRPTRRQLPPTPVRRTSWRWSMAPATVTFAQLGTIVDEPRPRSSCRPGRWSWCRRAPRSSRCRRTWPCSTPDTCRCSPATTTPSWPRRGTLRRSSSTARCGVGGSARPHDVHPDLALLLSTSGSTGSPKLVRLSHANLVSQRDGDRRVAGARPDRPGDHDAAVALLLRPLGAALAPGRRRRGRADDGVRRRPVLRVGAPRRRGHDGRRRAPHVRAAGAGRPRPRAHADAAADDAGRRADARRPAAHVAPAHAPLGRRARRDVRPDRGHGPHRHDAAEPRRPPPTGDRAGDPRRSPRRCVRCPTLPTASASWSTAGPT